MTYMFLHTSLLYLCCYMHALLYAILYDLYVFAYKFAILVLCCYMHALLYAIHVLTTHSHIQKSFQFVHGLATN